MRNRDTENKMRERGKKWREKVSKKFWRLLYNALVRMQCKNDNCNRFKRRRELKTI